VGLLDYYKQFEGMTEDEVKTELREEAAERAAREASDRYYGRELMAMGVGGTIPFMAMLGERFPSTQFLVTGVLGPHSNAHGPNEFLHIDYAKRLTGAVAHVLARHAAR